MKELDSREGDYYRRTLVRVSIEEYTQDNINQCSPLVVGRLRSLLLLARTSGSYRYRQRSRYERMKREVGGNRGAGNSKIICPSDVISAVGVEIGARGGISADLPPCRSL